MAISSQPKKVIILGAGATRGAFTANSELLPPLLDEFANIFDHKCIPISNSPAGHQLKKVYKDLIDITKTNNDIEKLYTLLFALERLNLSITPDRLILNNKDTKLMLDNCALLKSRPDLLKGVLGDEDYKSAMEILKYYSQNEDIILLANPYNLTTFIRQAIAAYLYNSVTDYFCKYHAKLFSVLEGGDAVVSFNYDQLADFTLFKLNKLSVNSFQRLGFSNIVLPDSTAKDFDSIKFIKVLTFPPKTVPATIRV